MQSHQQKLASQHTQNIFAKDKETDTVTK